MRFWICIAGFFLNLLIFFATATYDGKKLAIATMICFVIAATADYFDPRKRET